MLRLMLRRLSLLHVRGGVSPDSVPKWRPAESSPRPWRCFLRASGPKLYRQVFSTSVEVFLAFGRQTEARVGLLHVRGGVSKKMTNLYQIQESSPRPWRCFSSLKRPPPRGTVFSTSVEVFLSLTDSMPLKIGLLHVRGGVSQSGRQEKGRKRSSPRPWRCFPKRPPRKRPQKVFSTSVEVFPSSVSSMNGHVSLLHVRGDVSVPV